MSPTPGSAEWELEERELRRTEVQAQERSSRLQLYGVIIGAVATAAAAFAAVQAAEAVRASRDGMVRQVDEGRLSTALDAIGGTEPAQRIAGLTLLRRNAAERLDRARDAGASLEHRRDAHGLYSASLLIVQNYLRSGKVTSARPKTPAGEGFGFPKLASDTAHAGRELQALLELKDQVQRLNLGQQVRKPGVDLSHVVLYGQNWRRIDFSWVNHYSLGLDLRGADLRQSRWGTSYLGSSHLQCAILTDAVFGLEKPGGGYFNASLVSADLRGANLSGAKLHADMTNAKLDGANLAGADFTQANLNGVDLSKAINLDKATGLDRAEHYRPPPPGAKPATPDPLDGRTCLEHPDWHRPPPEAAPATG
jgi:uncharacterized protein YjbI with pentapeptide repeats